MDDNELNVTEYLVPANVSTKFEFIPGFGWSEFKYVAIALVIGVVLFFLTSFISMTKTMYLKDMPDSQKIGLKENANTKINGDKVTLKEEIIPTPVRLFFILIPTAGAFMVVRRDPSSGLSLITLVNGLKNFKNKQKRYLYVYNSGSKGR